MQKQFVSLFCLVLFFSCGNRGSQPAADADSIADNKAAVTDTATGSASSPADESQYWIWQADANKKTKNKNPQIDSSYYNVDTLLAGLNGKYPRIKLEKSRIGHDTLYAAIRDADYLTEQMGSTGAEQYIADAVLNLTAVPEIRFVRIDFEEGSHASPDVWSRDSFAGYKEVGR